VLEDGVVTLDVLLEDGWVDVNLLGSRFLTGSWQTVVSRTWPLLTERVVRTFGWLGFRAADLLGAEPISVHLRLSERDRRGLRPLLKLVWETLLNELMAQYDCTGAADCHPGVVTPRRGGSFAVPSLPEYAATVNGHPEIGVAVRQS
jgi:hypothetical protein